MTLRLDEKIDMSSAEGGIKEKNGFTQRYFLEGTINGCVVGL